MKKYLLITFLRALIYVVISKHVFSVKVTQLCPTLCNPMDSRLPGSSVHGLLQSRILEEVAIPFPRGSFQPRNRTRSPSLQVNSLLFEPASMFLRKVNKTEVGYLLESIFEFSSVQSLSHVRLFATPCPTAHQVSLFITNSWSSPKPMSIELVMPSNHLWLFRTKSSVLRCHI